MAVFGRRKKADAGEQAPAQGDGVDLTKSTASDDECNQDGQTCN